MNHLWEPDFNQVRFNSLETRDAPMSADTSAIAGGTNKTPMIRVNIIDDTGTKRAMPSVVKDPNTNMNFDFLSFVQKEIFSSNF